MNTIQTYIKHNRGKYNSHGTMKKILSTFNFKKIAKDMNECGWKWGRGHPKNKDYYSPTLKELKDTAKECMINALENSSRYSSIGGFGVRVIAHKPNKFILVFPV